MKTTFEYRREMFQHHLVDWNIYPIRYFGDIMNEMKMLYPDATGYVRYDPYDNYYFVSISLSDDNWHQVRMQQYQLEKYIRDYLISDLNEFYLIKD